MLQSNFDEIIKCHGNNVYKIPHFNKVQLECLRQLPTVITVSPQAVVEVLKDGADCDYDLTTEEETELDKDERDYGPKRRYKPPVAITQEGLEDLRREVEEEEER
jgi:hypothetical protein